jgi:hypothetical protein
MYIYVNHNGTNTWFDVEDDMTFYIVPDNQIGAVSDDLDHGVLPVDHADSLTGEEVYNIIRAQLVNTGREQPDDWVLTPFRARDAS